MMSAAIHTGFMRTSPFLVVLGMECSEAAGIRPAEARDTVFLCMPKPGSLSTQLGPLKGMLQFPRSLDGTPVLCDHARALVHHPPFSLKTDVV
jgi:hypothetical protein